MDEEIDILQCFRIFFKRGWIILLACIISYLLACLITPYNNKSEYAVCIKLIDKYRSEYELSNQRRLMSYVDIAKSNIVLEPACEEISISDITQEKILDMMEITYDLRSNSIYYVFQYEDAEDVITISHTVAEKFVIAMQNITGNSNVEIALKPDTAQMITDGVQQQKKDRMFYTFLFSAVFFSAIFLYGVFDEKLQILEDAEKECDFLFVVPECRRNSDL